MATNTTYTVLTSAPHTLNTNSPLYTTNSPYTFNTTGVNSISAGITGDTKIHINGKDADLVINGKSFNETMAKIEDRLGILFPNPGLEKEFDELRQAGEHYRQLEKKFLEQKKVFDILKNTDK
jgi:hypothetical protein